MSAGCRIAMWSGPRNISTAMMRAWENRADTVVVDEPLYAFYLKRTQADHPSAAAVIAVGETEWHKVVRNLTGPIPGDRAIFYQKQMTHHLLREIGRDWILALTNCFLIRDPARVISSYTKKNHQPSVEDLGFVQQAEIFDLVRAQIGATPPVIDADDVLRDPKRTLTLLCESVGVEFSESMLTWPAGPRATDGIWAKHWYAEVEGSTGFAPYRERGSDVPAHLRAVAHRCREAYDKLYPLRLR